MTVINNDGLVWLDENFVILDMYFLYLSWDVYTRIKNSVCRLKGDLKPAVITLDKDERKIILACHHLPSFDIFRFWLFIEYSSLLKAFLLGYPAGCTWFNNDMAL